MSSLTPYVYLPYPNFAAEEAERPYEPGPVTPVSAVTPVAPIGSGDQPPASNVPDEADALTLSEAARTGVENSLRNRVAQRQSAAPFFDPVRDSERIRNNRGIRELIASLATYNNRTAQERFNAALAVSVNYAPVSDPAANTAPTSQDLVYSVIGFTNPSVTPRDVRETIGLAITRWLAADGVFVPVMLNYASSDGFRFAPLSDAARAAQRSASVMASRERNRIAAYLREMARLTPSDFMFYDTTGLGALRLEERREFLERVERLLEQSGIEERAAELRYLFDEEGRLEVARMELDDERERVRLEQLAEHISGYYGVLMSSVRQYDAGIISVSMAR